MTLSCELLALADGATKVFCCSSGVDSITSSTVSRASLFDRLTVGGARIDCEATELVLSEPCLLLVELVNEIWRWLAKSFPVTLNPPAPSPARSSSTEYELAYGAKVDEIAVDDDDETPIGLVLVAAAELRGSTKMVSPLRLFDLECLWATWLDGDEEEEVAENNGMSFAGSRL